MAETIEVKKILYITMSNLGDALMGLPAFDFLRRECPDARITVMAGPRTQCVFQNHPDVHRLIVYDKLASLRHKIELFFRLKKERFDVIVDLRDTFYRWGIPARHKNPAWLRYPDWCVHSSQKHLFKAVVTLRGPDIQEEEFLEFDARRNPSFISPKDEAATDELLKKNNLTRADEFVLIVPGARSNLKKWHKEGYIEVIRSIKKIYGFPVAVVGDKNDQTLVTDIIQKTGTDSIDFSGKTTFGQLCSLVLRSKLVICNDSGVLHIASYLDKSVVGIYGPSDYKEYGPWSKRGIAVRKNILCAPCGQAHCRHDRECIKTITPYDVMLAVRLILEGEEGKLRESKYRRILIVRTDRIGDVLLSTPVIKALRDHYPLSYIAMIVSVQTKDLVEGNPYLDRVIVFDKDKQHKGLFRTLSFSKKLKQMQFDVAIILHPTMRVHFICFLAGIKERIGYDRKAPYFLTKTIPHTKQNGLKHEVEYNFDLLKPLGITTVYRELYMPIKMSSERLVEDLLKQAGITPQDKIVVVNPAASCISKRWPLQKFSEVIDRLMSAYPYLKVLIITDSIQRPIAEELLSLTESKPIDVSGRFNLSQLASLFKRCALVISNDSGPVHLSVAVGTPVISIFGRNQPGLGPRRWGPLGKSDVVLHKKTECAPCLAHACQQDFKCLEAVSVEEVLSVAARILKEQDKNKKTIDYSPDTLRLR